MKLYICEDEYLMRDALNCYGFGGGRVISIDEFILTPLPIPDIVYIDREGVDSCIFDYVKGVGRLIIFSSLSGSIRFQQYCDEVYFYVGSGRVLQLI